MFRLEVQARGSGYRGGKDMMHHRVLRLLLLCLLGAAPVACNRDYDYKSGKDMMRLGYDAICNDYRSVYNSVVVYSLLMNMLFIC